MFGRQASISSQNQSRTTEYESHDMNYNDVEELMVNPDPERVKGMKIEFTKDPKVPITATVQNFPDSANRTLFKLSPLGDRIGYSRASSHSSQLRKSGLRQVQRGPADAILANCRLHREKLQRAVRLLLAAEAAHSRSRRGEHLLLRRRDRALGHAEL